MQELIDQERSQVPDLLCDPQQLSGWTRAPETCVLWEEERRPGASAPI